MLDHPGHGTHILGLILRCGYSPFCYQKIIFRAKACRYGPLPVIYAAVFNYLSRPT